MKLGLRRQKKEAPVPEAVSADAVAPTAGARQARGARKGPGLNLFSRSATLLVIDAGPAGCEATLWAPLPKKPLASAPPPEPLWQGGVRETDPQVALALLVKMLRGSGLPMPRQAAVVTAEAVLTQADLPVDPKQPRPPLQMMEMARYEAEPAVAAHDAMWTAAEVLAVREALDPVARALIDGAMERAVHNDRGELLEFDEEALMQTGLDRAALDAALATQQGLQIHHQALACAWQGELVRDVHGQRSPHWRIAAMAQAARTHWLAALGEHGLRATGFWPRTGLAVLAEPPPIGTTLALELWPEQSLAMRLVDGRLASLRSEARNGLSVDDALLLELLAEWQSEPVTEIVLVVPDAQIAADTLVLPLQRMARTPVRVLAATASDAVLARARAVLAEAVLAPEKRRSLRIGLSDPRPALWKQPAWRPWLGLGALVLALAAWQGWVWWSILSMQRETQQLQQEQQHKASGGQSEAQLDAEARRLDQEANYLREELARLLKRSDGMVLIEQRRAMVPELIRSLGDAIGQRVVLDAVVESSDQDTRLGLEVRAWSPEVEYLQDYAAAVAELVEPLGMTVAPGDVASKPGRFRTPGYQIRFWLVPGEAELGEVPAQASGEEAAADGSAAHQPEAPAEAASPAVDAPQAAPTQPAAVPRRDAQEGPRP